jgi:hypothetical protein
MTARLLIPQRGQRISGSGYANPAGARRISFQLVGARHTCQHPMNFGVQSPEGATASLGWPPRDAADSGHKGVKKVATP